MTAEEFARTINRLKESMAAAHADGNSAFAAIIFQQIVELNWRLKRLQAKPAVEFTTDAEVSAIVRKNAAIKGA